LLDEQLALIRASDRAHGSVGHRNYVLCMAVLVRNLDQNAIFDDLDDRSSGALCPAAGFHLEFDDI
jgi:hypothetical protein